MDNENGDRNTSSAPGEANQIMDPLNVFAGHSIFGGGMPNTYGHHISNAYSALLSGGRAGQYPPAHHPPTTNSYANLGTFSVAASQAASLGMNPATSAAWWSMASQLAAHDYLARLQATGNPYEMGLLQSQAAGQGSGKQSQGGHNKLSTSHNHGASSTVTSSHHRDSLPSLFKDQHVDGPRAHGKQSSVSHAKSGLAAHSRAPIANAATITHSSMSSMINDPSGVLGGVRLPPDTEIIKYTSSIVGPKVPGTTNRGRKKTISLDPPSVSVTPTHSSTGLLVERSRKSKPAASTPVLDNALRAQHSPHVQTPISHEQDHRGDEMSELIKLQPIVSNGQATPLESPVPPECDAPLNLSLKPASSTPQTANTALQSLSSLSQSLGQMPERISRRKPGPKPRRVTQSPLPPPGPAPSASLAQLFAAADSPRPPSSASATVTSTAIVTSPAVANPTTATAMASPSTTATASTSEDTDPSTHHKDGRPRNLGRGVSKPKKNTVASLLAQSRALGIKPGLDPNSPLNHQVSILKANILQQQMQAAEVADLEAEEKSRTASPASLVEDIERNKKLVQQASLKTLEELRAMVSGQETYSETSSVPDVISSDTNSELDSDSEGATGRKREGERLNEDASTGKKRKVTPNEEELCIPLQRNWKREILVKGFSKTGHIRGEVTYKSPSGRRFKQYPEVLRYLEKNNITDLSRENFSFSTKVMLGDFTTPSLGKEAKHFSEQDLLEGVNEFKTADMLKMDLDPNKHDKQRTPLTAREAKKAAKEEVSRTKELTRFIKEQEKNEKQEAIKKEREQRNIQMMEEREMKRQQTALLKEQIYIQELSKQRELLYSVELERERRRQHMSLVKCLDVRKKLEEREKRRLVVKAEKMATREKRMEQRRIELDLLSEIRKPVEDMELTDLKPLPELSRIPGLKLSGQAFSDTLMVYEFLHNFGETLGFDMGSLPTLNSLQNALIGNPSAEEELLSIMTHMIICAIEDPGIPNPARHTTLLGQSLRQADITHSNISEILRIYLYANATGEVKSLCGMQFEREREKRMSDHHNIMTEGAGEEPESGKNAAFFIALRENSTWKMSETLKHKPFLALNPTLKAKILHFLCNELLQNKAVVGQVERALEAVAQLKRDRWTIDSKLRKLRHMHNRKVRHAAMGIMGGKLSLEGVDDDPPPPKVHDDEEEVEGESGHESDGTQPEEEEDKKLSIEEMARKLEKLRQQATFTMKTLGESGGHLRAICYGQDRYWRRYWNLPVSGGLFVEGMESAEPELFEDMLQRRFVQEDADSLETPDIRSEYDADVLQNKQHDYTGDDDDEMPLLTPEVDTETLLSKFKEHNNMDYEPAELPLIKEDGIKNGQMEEMEVADKQGKNDCSGEEEEADSKTLLDDKKSHPFQFGRMDEKVGEDSTITNGQAELEPVWFNVLPREPCDTTSVTSTASTFRCGTENSEVRIPVFPAPPASPSPSQCDSPSPAPLTLTPEESVQLEHVKIHGLPRPAPAKPVPYDLRCGWWRITDPAVLQQLVESLHTRGAREKELRRSIMRLGSDHSWTTTLNNCVRPGIASTELLVTAEDLAFPIKTPLRDGADEWNYDVALRVDMALLEQVEVMEDKVANASMQIKGWKVPPRASTEEGRHFQPSCSHPPGHLNPIIVAKSRLTDLECAIERRYLKPPLGVPNVSAVDMNPGVNAECEMIPKGLALWREATGKCQTAAQLCMSVQMLEASIAWDKSIMKANCQFCRSGDNEDKLLLCDGCDKGYHTYCFKPKMENIPEGDWYCYECLNKATGDKVCIVCGKKLGRNLVLCEDCPKAYHTDCLQPPIPKVPRGKWHCSGCLSKLTRKRSNTKRTINSSNLNNTSPCSSLNRSFEDGCSSNADPILSPIVPEEVPPESPPPLQAVVKKEKSSGKKLVKEMAVCKQVLDELESHDEAWPFLLPVNTKQFPTYKKIIKCPMDFSTVRKRLMDSVYKSREEFCSDVRLVFNNCETFNEDDSPVGKAGHNMRLFFETKWTEMIQKTQI